MPRRAFPYASPSGGRRRSGFVAAAILLIAAVVVATGALLGATADRAMAPPVLMPTVRPASDPTVGARPPGEGGADPPRVLGVTPPPELPLPAVAGRNPLSLALQQNPLHDLTVPQLTGCPAPRRVSTMEELEMQARAEMTCIQAAWRPVLEAHGYAAGEIPVYFYRGDRVSTPCSVIVGPAVYCAARGGAVYFGENTLRGSRWFALGVKGVAGHEYGHHLQAVAGLFSEEAKVGTDESARRLELQATCLAYAMIAHDDAVTVTREIYEDSSRFLRAVVEDDIHGSKESVSEWGLRGLYAETVGDCNTWVADAESVT